MAPLPDSEAQDRAARWLAAWDGQGIHRTATVGDEAGAEWLAEEAAALGAATAIDVSIEEFPIERLDPVTTFLEIGGERIDAVPVFDAPPTDATGIAGRLDLVDKASDGDADIVVVELAPLDVHDDDYKRLRRDGKHRGFVILCAGDSPGMGPLNAERFRDPYGVPTVHVSSEARDAVLAAVAAGAPARLVAESRRVTAYAGNVVVTLNGAESTGTPLVVMTPRSSWWQSTAERGGGIVCWLESLRALLHAGPPSRPVIFTANTGHELGHLGLDEFLARRPGLDQPVDRGGPTWVHYGANIGAAAGGLKVVSPHDDLRTLCSTLLAQVSQPYELVDKTTVPNGETRDIQLASGHCVALVGDNKLFHLPQDRWPDSIDLAAVTRAAFAGARIVLELAHKRTLPANPLHEAAPMRVIRLARSDE